jgi:type VI secretion system protein ImpF
VARDDSQSGLRASLIDRLIDPEAEGTSWRRGFSVEQMIDTVRRDLENLLNSHRAAGEVADELPEVRDSLITYGMPDLASIRSSVTDARARVSAAIEESIARFEPRLTNVRVVSDPSADPKTLRLEFQIHATLHMDPAPEVSFVTVLKLSTGETSIQQANG